MGCDIHGYIEAQKNGHWLAMESVKSFVNRNYDMFGLLFGVRNNCGFEPVAAQRGLPTDSPSSARLGSYHSLSYISGDEIAGIDWSRRSSQLNERTTCYRLVNGEEVYESKFAYSSELASKDYEILATGESIRKGNYLYRREYTLYKDVLSPDWQKLFDYMAQLRQQFDNVRLVVGFDS